MRVAGLHLPVLLGLYAAGVVACGGSGSDSPPAPSAPKVDLAKPTAISVVSGDGQTARIKSQLANSAVFRVVNVNGTPLSNVSVTFSVTGGGSIAAATATTTADGTVQSPPWTLGSTPGANSLVATVVGVTPATVTATARLPRWTFMVYMAADNNLTSEGISNLDQMDAAGTNPEVQVVVQAEFSPTAFRVAGVPASAANLSSTFNTFRYTVSTAGNTRFGPETAVAEIGNVDMSSPQTLRSFVDFAKANYPAERYALVLWNHGGGYTGLIEDETSNPGHLMSLSDLGSALSGEGLEILDFDMCLMAGYETLSSVRAATKYAVFSEEVFPGPGNPYTDVLRAFYQNPTTDSRTLSGQLVDLVNTYYAGAKASTTISAFDIGGLANFEQALNSVATSLNTNVGTLAPALSSSISHSQKYSLSYLTDLGDFLDSLSTRSIDPTVKAQVSALKSQLTSPSFRISSRARDGGGSGSAHVSRSTGLNILLPSGQGSDVLPSTGTASLSNYQALMPGKPWTQFVTTWTQRSATLGYRDLGTSRLELYLVWDTASVRRNADVDLWVLEPNGNLYIPWLGTVTPNGLLTGDSYDTRSYYEGYFTNRFVQTGRYKFYANLASDPTNAQPPVDIQSRVGPTAAFASLYSPTYPRLSLQVSWLKDPAVTFAKVEAGAYTDLRFMAYWDVAAASGSMSPSALRANTGAIRPGEEGVGGPTPTAAQLEAVRSRLRAPDRNALPRVRTDRLRPVDSPVSPTPRIP